ncbi:Succinate dehydrogenase membrane protein [Candidatus Johnevansia muelleri]|uniref:Succinate dehydrogenase hydrophobic membrane anchor subunit n=1 Tax=Candidatus Johnevansia muelleri TaxID=1495769 RepID=A0A078KEE6_9GAMM|nr:Succinate dehydrogenase membrane protein [Candidatus Evansia muelleri]
MENINYIYCWIIQRISAIILTIYTIFIIIYILYHPNLDYTTWSLLFYNFFMRMFTILAIISGVAHTWIGLFTIITDYIKCSYIRLCMNILIIIYLFLFLCGYIEVVYGVFLCNSK